MRRIRITALLILHGFWCSHAFSIGISKQSTKLISSCRQSNFNTALTTATKLRLSSITPEDLDDRSFVLTKEEINPILTIKVSEAKEKLVNAYGLYVGAMAVLTSTIWMMAMMIVDGLNRSVMKDFDVNHALCDKTGKYWSKGLLHLIDSYPTISGDVEQLHHHHKVKGTDGKEESAACLYVANHASWLDIPVLCTVLDGVFKFIAKDELIKIPCIGDQLKYGEHIIINRDDRRSQLKSFKDSLTWLKKGVPIMGFPEGRRSSDGRLLDFKGGMFSIAKKAKVPIIPITIKNTHAIMPSCALLPVQRGNGKLHLHIHSPIDPEGKSEEELNELVRDAFLSQLSSDQRPLDEIQCDDSMVVNGDHGSGSVGKGGDGDGKKELQSTGN